ncbi:MAG: polymer-forming cytoskeletal protein [Alphaproteobacteria bacterium]|nr:polymer-forming cytoskeletal protein [Alphaproteobacteria bacterium]
MFTNKGRSGDSMPAAPEPAAPRRVPSGQIVPSILANGVRFVGTIEADGAELQINGEIEGNVRGGSITIGDTGMIKGDVVCETVTVQGRVEGAVRARKVQLMRNAHVLGDIVHQSLSVEMGAVFEGQCRYLQDPLRDQPGISQGASSAAPSHDPTFSGGSPFGEPASEQDRLSQGVIVTGASA